MTNQEFIEQIAKYVQKYASSYGILVHSPIIAQAILESGWGKSKLASTYNNYFGLKCGTKWTGKSVNLTTQEEYTAGTMTTIQDNFRVFDSMEDGVKGYFEFIQLARYANLKGITDAKTYLETIKVDGYATSSTYVENNMKLVTQYELTNYDGKVDNKVGKTRSAMVSLAKSWIGKNEADGSHKSIIDIYNSFTPHPRGYVLKYSDAWCAGTTSALAIKLGYTDIIPVECSCYYLIELAKAKGIWVESDSYIPKMADIVLYDWDDSGSGDNAGNPDHVGLVESCNGSSFIVIEGNKNNAVGTRTMSVNGRYIRGFITPKYDSDGTSTSTPSATKSITDIAKEVLAGQWGNGDDRKTALTNAGYDYSAVQKKVNELLNGSTALTPSKSVETVAKEVINGQWGNGDARKSALENAGYSYSEVQKKVNELLTGSSKKSVTDIAKEVIAGKWGNGSDRKKKIESAGYDYSAVQAKVNSLLK